MLQGLDTTIRERSTPFSGKNPGRHAGLRRLPVFQCGKPDAYSWPLDANDHYT